MNEAEAITTHKLHRDNKEFIDQEGKRKAFHTGSTSSCRAHIRQHFKLYQERCKVENIPEHHWTILHRVWKVMEEARQGNKSSKQGTLDKVMKPSTGPTTFTRENLLHMVTQFITVDDQVRLTIETTLKFSLTRLCLPVTLRCEKDNVSELPCCNEAKINIARFAHCSRCCQPSSQRVCILVG